jgi:hypothetical protein
MSSMSMLVRCREWCRGPRRGSQSYFRASEYSCGGIHPALARHLDMDVLRSRPAATIASRVGSSARCAPS